MAFVIGTLGEDDIGKGKATNYADIILALASDDKVCAGGGNDKVIGGGGADIIGAGAGNDVVYGDRYFGNEGFDKFDNYPRFAEGADSIDGQKGDDTIYGGGGDDQLQGSQGKDVIYGGDDNDCILGGRDNDSLYGDDGKDTMDGGAGKDLMYGGDKADDMRGGGGDDELSGGYGKDYFVFRASDVPYWGSATDVITDFDAYDKIVLCSDGRGKLRVEDYETKYDDVTLYLNNGQTILLEDAKGKLDRYDIVSVGKNSDFCEVNCPPPAECDVEKVDCPEEFAEKGGYGDYWG